MIPAIGTMIAAYIITKMFDLMFEKGGFTGFLSVVTILITLVCVLILWTSGIATALQ